MSWPETSPRFLATLFLALVLQSPNAVVAFAFCSQPDAPDPPSTFSKPDVPYCIRDRSCEDYEIQRYKSDVEDYVRKLKNYASEAEEFHGDAVQYAECEIDDVVNQHK